MSQANANDYNGLTTFILTIFTTATWSVEQENGVPQL